MNQVKIKDACKSAMSGVIDELWTEILQELKEHLHVYVVKRRGMLTLEMYDSRNAEPWLAFELKETMDDFMNDFSCPSHSPKDDAQLLNAVARDFDGISKRLSARAKKILGK